jgi:hypothetical protein
MPLRRGACTALAAGPVPRAARKGAKLVTGIEISRESLSWPLSPPLTVQDAVVEVEGRWERRRLLPKRRVRVAQKDGCHHHQDT